MAADRYAVCCIRRSLDKVYFSNTKDILRNIVITIHYFTNFARSWPLLNLCDVTQDNIVILPVWVCSISGFNLGEEVGSYPKRRLHLLTFHNLHNKTFFAAFHSDNSFMIIIQWLTKWCGNHIFPASSTYIAHDLVSFRAIRCYVGDTIPLRWKFLLTELLLSVLLHCTFLCTTYMAFMV
jgi:hypothetical protein